MTLIQTLKNWKDSLGRSFKKNLLLLFISAIFLTYQLFISFTLWNRSGNVPPGFGDSLGYIFGIEKVIKYHDLFPHIPYFGSGKYPSAHLTYLGYNSLAGLIGIIFHCSGENIFYYSFYLGKIILLLALLFLLKNIFNNHIKLISFVLLFLSFFVGDGSFHGFFWVVPSFWMLLIFFLLFGITNSNKKINYPLLFLLCLLYITIHPLSVYSISIFVFYCVYFRLFTKSFQQNSLIVTGTLILCAIIWQSFVQYLPYLNEQSLKNTPNNGGNNLLYILPIIIIPLVIYFLHKKLHKKTVLIVVISFFSIVLGAALILNNSFSKLSQFVQKYSKTTQINSLFYITSNQQTKDVLPKISNSTPNLPQIRIFDALLENWNKQSISQSSSLILSWNSYFSWFFRFPPLLILLLFSFYIQYRKERWSIISLFLACILFCTFSLLNPVGYRSIIFLFPITIIFLSSAIFDLLKSLKNNQNKKIVFLYYASCPIFLITLFCYAIFGYVSTRYYSTIANYQVNANECIEYIKKFPPNDTQIFFTSVEGINYFLNYGVDNYYTKGINYFNAKNLPKNILLINENRSQIDMANINMPINDTSSLLEKVDQNSDFVTRINCDIFQLQDISVLFNPPPEATVSTTKPVSN